MNRLNLVNPASDYRLLPFWFWNGDMEETEVRTQIAEMAAQGLGGFFLCARQGLTVPYLSQKWFRLIELAVAEAKKHGLKAWLYDEFPYPSGIAGGEVTILHPEAKQRIWQKHQAGCKGGQEVTLDLPLGRVYLACAVPYREDGLQLDWERKIDLAAEIGIVQPEELFQEGGLTPYNKKRYFSASPAKRLVWTALPGAWEVIVIGDEELNSFKYYGTYVDPCHPEAMASFIATTHDRYAQHLGAELGKTVPGIFTDEVGLEGRFPWSPQLPPFFYKLKGYSLLEPDTLLDLWFERGERTAVVRYDYMDSIEKLLRENYHRRMREWCDGHGIAYVTEVNSLRGATQLYSHIPSADSGHEKLGIPLKQLLRKNAFHIRYNPKMASSIARQGGRKQVLAECFHSIGWSMTLLDAKWMIDRFAALGVNTYTPHAYFYSTDGIRKHDAPPSQFLQNPYWRWMSHLTGYAGRMSYLLRQGVADIRVAVLDPIASLWSLGGNAIHGFQPVAGEDPGGRLERLKTEWASVCEQLLLHQIDFDHLDPELLETHAEVRDGRLQVGDASYELVILPPLRCLEPAAWSKLEQFLQQGGGVMALGRLPELDLTAEDKVCERMRAAFGLSGALPEPIAPVYSGQADRQSTGLSDGQMIKPSDRQPEKRSDRQSEKQLNREPGSSLDGKEEAARWYRGQHRAYFYSSPASVANAEAAQQYLAKIEEQVKLAAILELDHGNREGLLMQVRRMADDALLLFVTNQEDQEAEGRIVVPHRGLAKAERLSLMTGQAERIGHERHETGGSIPFRLKRYESCWFQLHAHAEPPPSSEQALTKPVSGQAPASSSTLSASGQPSAASISRPSPEGSEMRAEEEQPLRFGLGQRQGDIWHVRAEQANLLRLSQFRCMLDEQHKGGIAGWHLAGLPQGGCLTEPQSFIELLAGADGRLRPAADWSSGFGVPRRMKPRYPLTLWYETQFIAEELPVQAWLTMESAAITGQYMLYVNGTELSAEALQPMPGLGAHRIGGEVSSLLRSGANRLTVCAEIARDWHGIVEPLFIAGDFGVSFNEQGAACLTAPRTALELRRGPWSGYPYYCGTLCFEQSFELEELPQQEQFEWSMDDWDAGFDEAAELVVNGHSLGARCLGDYCWTGSSRLLYKGENKIEVKLTNTLIGSLDGKYFDHALHQLGDVRKALS